MTLVVRQNLFSWSSSLLVSVGSIWVGDTNTLQCVRQIMCVIQNILESGPVSSSICSAYSCVYKWLQQINHNTLLIFLTAVIFCARKREFWLLSGFLANYPESMQGGHAGQEPAASQPEQQNLTNNLLPDSHHILNPPQKNQKEIPKTVRKNPKKSRRNQQQQVSPSSRISQTISSACWLVVNIFLRYIGG